jgi:hypothetical protein
VPFTADPTELESSAKKEFSKAEDKVMSKVPESVGGNKIELYSGRYYATCAVGGAVACGATHTFGEFSLHPSILERFGRRDTMASERDAGKCSKARWAHWRVLRLNSYTPMQRMGEQ